MTREEALTRLREAFPKADDVMCEATDHGNRWGFGVRYGAGPDCRRFAVHVPSLNDIEGGIEVLRDWCADKGLAA